MWARGPEQAMIPRVAYLDCSTDVLVHKSKMEIGGKLIHKKSGTNYHSRRLGVPQAVDGIMEGKADQD